MYRKNTQSSLMYREWVHWNPAPIKLGMITDLPERSLMRSAIIFCKQKSGAIGDNLQSHCKNPLWSNIIKVLHDDHISHKSPRWSTTISIIVIVLSSRWDRGRSTTIPDHHRYRRNHILIYHKSLRFLSSAMVRDFYNVCKLGFNLESLKIYYAGLTVYMRKILKWC